VMPRRATKVTWTGDLDELLLAFDGRGMSYKAISSALSVIQGTEIGWQSVRYRLHALGAPPHPPHGLGVAALRARIGA
jgi:hypothetical protein